MARPRVGLTVGDPAGIGPEIAHRAAADARVQEVCTPVVFETEPGLSVEPGQVSAAAGRAAYDVIVRATDAALRHEVDAIATAPINKLSLALAGLQWKGHTDLLAALCGAPRVAMMFDSPRLRVVLATVHIPLAAVPRELTAERLHDTLQLTAEALPRFGVARPRIAVAGLNPHAGEGGVLGDEEDRVIAPAIARARAAGHDVSGPYPGDTVFSRAVAGDFDVVIACYHDQGLIPVKLLGFGQAVNVTLGLPIVRTSVDHGTAFDIAGKGLANPASMIAAVLLAARLARANEERSTKSEERNDGTKNR